jgi:RNase P subunit RPR2
MFYCKNCHNFLNISKTINQNKIKSGGDDHSNHSDEDNDRGYDNHSDSDNETKAKESLAYFVCNSCGYYRPIESETLLYTKQYEELNDDEFEDYHLLIYDNTLPRTYKYMCPNKKCDSHKYPEKKEAVIYKNKNYRVLYVCTICEDFWFVV